MNSAHLRCSKIDGETSALGETQGPLYRILLRFGDPLEKRYAAEKVDSELFNERAAIREFDGGMNRELAELAASNDVIEFCSKDRNERG
jgi:hypothetical protein